MAHDIVPDDFSGLEDAVNARSSTKQDQRIECPKCESVSVTHRNRGFQRTTDMHPNDPEYKCDICYHRFDL